MTAASPVPSTSQYSPAVPPALVSTETTANPEPSRLGIDGQHLPAPAEALSNQQIANTIAQHLRQSGLLRQYNIDITFQQGVAELTGWVNDIGQREAAVRIVRTVPGVARVVDRLNVRSSAVVVKTNAITPEPSVEAAPAPSRVPETPGRMPEAPGIGRGAVGGANAGLPPEPTPIFQAPPSGFGMAPVPDPFMQPPRMPPYAWPTYAPYNNYSRVAYPTLYPYEAWPFIGPFYPFPKVPLGWRSVTLEWKDGHWWYGKNATGHDWWRIRYW
jgi:hypothetical protein